MVYLLIGEDTQLKDQKIEELKVKYLPSPDSYLFDFDSLHAPKLSAETLKKSLLNLPVLSDYRFVLIRLINKLDQHNKDIILESLQSAPKSLILVLESEGAESNAFMKKIEASATVIRFGQKNVTNVFDMTKAFEQKNLAGALKTLRDLIEEGQHPLQIMGVIVWFWGKQRARLSSQGFNEGLLALQETDLNIKRSRMNPDYAVEVLLTKLFLIKVC